MNTQNIPKWTKDLISYIDTMPYAQGNVGFVRAGNRVVQLQTEAVETFKYTENQAALEDLIKLLTQFVNEGYNGDVTLKLDFKNGKIETLGTYSIKQTNY